MKKEEYNYIGVCPKCNADNSEQGGVGKSIDLTKKIKCSECDEKYIPLNIDKHTVERVK